jgi:hypothetical protein
MLKIFKTKCAENGSEPKAPGKMITGNTRLQRPVAPPSRVHMMQKTHIKLPHAGTREKFDQQNRKTTRE